MDGPRNHRYGARRGYDLRTRCVCSCKQRRQGVGEGKRHQISALWGRGHPAVATVASYSTGCSCLCCSATFIRTVRKPRLFSCGDGCRKPSLMRDPEAVPAMQRVDFSHVQEPACCGTIQTIETARGGSLLI